MNIIRLTKGCCMLLLILLFSSSCSTYSRLRDSSVVRYTDSINIQTVFRDSVIYQVVQRDSIRVHDSVTVKIDSTGRVTDRWHTVYKYVTSDAQLEFYKAKIDSLESIKRRDSIVTETIYKEPTMFQKFQMKAFWIMSGLIILSLVFFMIKRFS